MMAVEVTPAFPEDLTVGVRNFRGIKTFIKRCVQGLFATVKPETAKPA
jgi:hypothetical protein